ncbi:MAG: integrase core domain-containing protein [Polyangia bacterium]|jgi:hypothetical protein|nr:integrase core domain-containing protein [Polyangia bacterium]
MHINFIKRISRDHPEYGAARIALELKLKLGVEHAESTIDRYRVLIHDNDDRYGQLGHTVCLFNESKGKAHSCRSTLAAWLWQTLNIRSVPIPYKAPNAAAHMERLIGTLRRECLDHLLIWNERHLHLVLSEMIKWYCGGRVHQGIHGIPDPDPDLAEPKPAV